MPNRRQAQTKASADSVAWSKGSGEGRLVVVSNRVADPSAKCQSGGLAVAVAHDLKGSCGLWLGWSGGMREDATTTARRVGERGGRNVVELGHSPEDE